MFDSCFPPLRMCLECVQGPSFAATQSYAQFQNEALLVRLDTNYMGENVVLLKNDHRICGTGAALGSAPIVQNKAYFQVSVQQDGIWGIGLGTRSVDLNTSPVIDHCWVLRHDGQVFSNGVLVGTTTETVEEGDCIGVAFDHVELKFYKNGVLMPVSVSNIRGQVYPLVYVDNNAILDVAFRNFAYNLPDGYEEIMKKCIVCCCERFISKILFFSINVPAVLPHPQLWNARFNMNSLLRSLKLNRLILRRLHEQLVTDTKWLSTVTLIPGDGVGPELADAVKDVVKNTGIPVEFNELHLSEIDRARSHTVDEVVNSIKNNHNVALKGAIQELIVRDTDHDTLDINVRLKQELDLFAGVVNIRTLNGIKTRHNKKLDMIVVREQTEGEYSSLEHELVPGVVECLKISTEKKSRRIAKFAFDCAVKYGRKKVTAVHKANIMKLGDGLFLRVCAEVSELYPNIKFDSMIIDNCCMQLVSRPEQFDVIVTSNLYGNVVSNLAAGLVGGAGVVAGRSVGQETVVFELGARHSFQKAFGRRIANPAAMFLSFADLLEHISLQKYGKALRTATEDVIAESKVRTRDLGGFASTTEFTDAVINKFTI